MFPVEFRKTVFCIPLLRVWKILKQWEHNSKKKFENFFYDPLEWQNIYAFLVYEVKSTEDYLMKILLLSLSKEVVLHVILVHCLSTEQEIDRGNTEMIYGVDVVRVNVPLHIRIYCCSLYYS